MILEDQCLVKYHGLPPVYYLILRIALRVDLVVNIPISKDRKSYSVKFRLRLIVKSKCKGHNYM